jgi:hypothetical protein
MTIKETTSVNACLWRNVHRLLLGALLCLAVSGALAPSAGAIYGVDDFGVAELNDGVGPLSDAPAFDDVDDPDTPGINDPDAAFWAGACDRRLAPAIGDSIASPGIGSRPSFVWAGNGLANVQFAAPATPAHCIDMGAPNKGLQLWEHNPTWRLTPSMAAGGHPDGSASMMLRRGPDGLVGGSTDNIVVELPPGFSGDPTAVPKCTAEQFAHLPPQCSPQTQVGVLELYLEGSPTGGNNLGGSDYTIYPMWNLEPRRGNAAEIGFAYASGQRATSVRLVATARTNSDFGVTAYAGQIPAALPPIGQIATLWGVPWAAHNDIWRGPTSLWGTACGKQNSSSIGAYLPVSGLSPACEQHYDPSWGPIKPFLSNPTECDGAPDVTRTLVDSYQLPGAFTEGLPDGSDPDWKRASSPSPDVTGCDKNPFAPGAGFTPTSTAPGAPSGIDADITVPQNETPPPSVTSANAGEYWTSDAGRATAQLDKTVVKLPKGLTLNPAAAAGLESCSNEQIGVTGTGNPYTFDNSEPTCPDGSYIGTAEATTPLLEGSPNLTGEVVLGTPQTTNPQGEADGSRMFRLFLVLRNEDRGLLAKVYGTTVAGLDGQLTTTFDKNPRVPVENIKVKIKGGSRGVLATPQTCGEKSTETEMTPWTAAHGGGGPVRNLVDTFTISGDCSFGFAPRLTAGMSNRDAREHGTFTFKFSRDQDDQWVEGLTAVLPTGLLASVKGLPLCSSGQAATGDCPEASRIGTVDASAGAGTPFVIEKKGSAYLTQGYKGCAYGIVVVVPVEAGPFRGALALDDIVVRQKVCVDPRDAHVTATSDPLPLVHHGIPIRAVDVTVLVDRPNFMLNPSDCAQKRVEANFTSPDGAAAQAVAPFRAAGCAGLPFKPSLELRLTGRKQMTTSKHPGIRALVRQAGVGEAGIERAQVRLPKSIALDPENAQALCEFVDGTSADPENRCPKGSIVGRARAVTPLLDRPLVGDVFFVKNIRIDPVTGNQIRTLPMIVVALRGEIAVNLVGESSTTKAGKLVNTFAAVPDAPISQFNLNINGGENGILAVTRTRKGRINLCRKGTGKQIAEADMDGQNGRRHDFDVTMKTPCPKAKKGKKTSKRKAAAGKRRAGARRS